MNTSDMKFSLAGHLGFSIGYLSGMKRRVQHGMTISVRNIETLELRLKTIEKILFEDEGEHEEN